MPIGNIDYISTAPWNDAMNPWPAYAQLTLSAADMATDTYVLYSFDPAVGSAYYASVLYGNDLGLYLANGIWAVYDDALGDLYRFTTARRGIPAGWLQGNTAWTQQEGADETTLSIVPDANYLTPWEHRRRRLLEIV